MTINEKSPSPKYSSIPKYPSIYTLGSRELKDVDIFDENVVIQEKIDGSQFKMLLGLNGRLHCHSRRTEISLDNPGMFDKAVDTAFMLADSGKMKLGWVYYCEYLRAPKHNALTYSRTPRQNIVVFDILVDGQFLLPEQVAEEAEAMGLEAVFRYPNLPTGATYKDYVSYVTELLEKESSLGGTKIEGVVIKNYNKCTKYDRIAVAKFVAPAFKERTTPKLKLKSPKYEIVDTIIESLRTEARWRKAVQHLREDGRLTGTPKDIGPLIKEINRDILKEEKEEIKEILFNHFWKEISKGAIAGFADWYKNRLVDEDEQV